MIKQLKYITISIIYSLLIINNCNSVENKILFKVNNIIITSLDIFTELEYLKTINKEFKKILIKCFRLIKELWLNFYQTLK